MSEIPTHDDQPAVIDRPDDDDDDCGDLTSFDVCLLIEETPGPMSPA